MSLEHKIYSINVWLRVTWGCKGCIGIVTTLLNYLSQIDLESLKKMAKVSFYYLFIAITLYCINCKRGYKMCWHKRGISKGGVRLLFSGLRYFHLVGGIFTIWNKIYPFKDKMK